MKKGILPLLAALFAGGAYAGEDRVIVTDTQAVMVFVQKQSIVHKDKYVEAWVTSDFEHMRTLPDGSGYLCRKEQKLFDCQSHKVAVMTTYYFEQDECAGAIAHRETRPHPVFTDIPPSGESDREFHTVCHAAHPENAKKHPH
jgi:hypothetical protein